jgi:dTDP-4-dehydrorhamnose 3,5-epimerase
VEFFYKTTEYYAPEDARSILWGHPAIAVKWPIFGESMLSIKDQQAKTLAIAEYLA